MADSIDSPSKFDEWSNDDKVAFLKEAMKRGLISPDADINQMLAGKDPFLTKADMETLKKELKKLI